MNFLFGKLDLKGKFVSKYDIIKRGLEEKSEVGEYGFNWGFVEIQEIEVEIESKKKMFFTGYLAKYKDIKEEIVDVNEREFADTSVSHHVEAKSLFFLEEEYDIIAFSHEVNRLGKNQFCNVFAKLFKDVHGRSIESVQIETLGKGAGDEEAEKIKKYNYYKKEIKKFDKIYKISITLWPANPFIFRMWKKINEKLRDLGAKLLSTTYESGGKNETLKPVFRGSDILPQIAMVTWGYGRAEISGEIEGQPVTLAIEEKPIEEKEEEKLVELELDMFDIETSPDRILVELIPSFNSLINQQRK